MPAREDKLMSTMIDSYQRLQSPMGSGGSSSERCPRSELNRSKYATDKVQHFSVSPLVSKKPSNLKPSSTMALSPNQNRLLSKDLNKDLKATEDFEILSKWTERTTTPVLGSTTPVLGSPSGQQHPPYSPINSAPHRYRLVEMRDPTSNTSANSRITTYSKLQTEAQWLQSRSHKRSDFKQASVVLDQGYISHFH